MNEQQTEKEKQQLEQQKLKFDGMIEGKDFVACKVCGWVDTRISGHVLSVHNLDKRQYRSQYGDAHLICDAVKSKTAFRGSHSVETRRQMTKSHMGQTPWNKGLTKDTNDSLKSASIKMKELHSR
jgi:hypothetical protein